MNALRLRNAFHLGHSKVRTKRPAYVRQHAQQMTSAVSVTVQVDIEHRLFAEFLEPFDLVIADVLSDHFFCFLFGGGFEEESQRPVTEGVASILVSWFSNPQVRSNRLAQKIHHLTSPETRTGVGQSHSQGRPTDFEARIQHVEVLGRIGDFDDSSNDYCPKQAGERQAWAGVFRVPCGLQVIAYHVDDHSLTHKFSTRLAVPDAVFYMKPGTVHPTPLWCSSLLAGLSKTCWTVPSRVRCSQLQCAMLRCARSGTDPDSSVGLDRRTSVAFGCVSPALGDLQQRVTASRLVPWKPWAGSWTPLECPVGLSKNFAVYSVNVNPLQVD